MPFLNNLAIEALKKSNFYKLTKTFSYQDKVYGKITVPRGFKTDFASVPKLFHGVIDDDASYIREAAVIHDYLYSSGELPRVECDKVLERAMKELGAKWYQRKLVYYAVRVFGGLYFKKKRGL